MSRFRAKAFWRNQTGATAALYALALPALVAVGGVGFDYARLAGMDSELQNAADQAALAAATQLDGKSGACTRAINAARGGLVTNATILANDSGQTTTVDVAPTSGTTEPDILFFENRDDAEDYTGASTDPKILPGAANCDEDARFVFVRTEERAANYALTPIAGALRGDIIAAATAGLGSSVCKVPPIMLCHPDPTGPAINWDDWKGVGVQATGHSPGHQGNGEAGSGSAPGGGHWSPGNFGFLEVASAITGGENKNKALLKALAYANPPVDCVPLGDNRVSTGNPQSTYDAINTRFDILNFPTNENNENNVLSSCGSGNCPAASNIVTDLINTKLSPGNGGGNGNGNGNGGGGGGGGGGQSCKLGTSGWELPTLGREFKPIPTPTNGYYDDNGVIDAMGLPRDNCHYTSFVDDGNCPRGRFGDKQWAWKDYFRVNHGGTFASGVGPNSGYSWPNWTRYDTYLWEKNGHMPSFSNNSGRYSAPSGQCATGTSVGDRRVLTVAIVSNCSELNGTSKPVDIDAWVDVFLVEPTIDGGKDTARHNAYKDSIYVEIIGRSSIAGGNGSAAQMVRRDVPYLVR